QASASTSSQYGFPSRCVLPVTDSTCTCTRAETGPFCTARRISVSVSRFIGFECITSRKSRCSVSILPVGQPGLLAWLVQRKRQCKDACQPDRQDVCATLLCYHVSEASRM